MRLVGNPGRRLAAGGDIGGLRGQDLAAAAVGELFLQELRGGCSGKASWACGEAHREGFPNDHKQGRATSWESRGWESPSRSPRTKEWPKATRGQDFTGGRRPIKSQTRVSSPRSSVLTSRTPRTSHPWFETLGAVTANGAATGGVRVVVPSCGRRAAATADEVRNVRRTRLEEA